MWWVIIPAALFGWLMVSRGNMYRKLFSEEHINEIASLAQALAQEAKASMQSPKEQPPHRVTSVGLVIAYSLRKKEQDTVAHLSLSYQGGWFASTAAGVFVAYLRQLLNLPTPIPVLGVSANGVYHAEWPSITEIPEVSTQSPQQLYKSANEEGRQLSTPLLARIE